MARSSIGLCFYQIAASETDFDGQSIASALLARDETGRRQAPPGTRWHAPAGYYLSDAAIWIMYQPLAS